MLKERRYFDYSAILEEAVRALRTDKGLRRRLAERCKIVVVDEYQDLAPIQESLILELHKLGAALMVVGDDDQTLYQWRGSDLNNMLTFSDRYLAVKRVTLEDNFRSSEGIINVARLAIEDNKERLPKQMQTVDAQPYQEGDIIAMRFDTPEKEAEYIAVTCRSLLGTFVNSDGGRRAISWSDMAVLVRVGKCGEIVREALQRAGIPAVSVGMSSLFEAKEAEAARQLFYLLAGSQDVTIETVLQAWLYADLGLGPA
jgi:DNA helicase-2/ATP-dependent DNA helicase PcrA